MPIEQELSCSFGKNYLAYLSVQRTVFYPLVAQCGIGCTEGLTWEHQRLCLTHNQCEEILQSMKSGLRQAENQHQLGTYQNWLDARSLQNSSHPLAVEFQAFTSCFSKTWSCS
uniref:rho guanine nucleotide exchange factor 11-like n=1 Tax=Podarcis muralis TaxID=64176 RepID=UPI00109FC382|nr:rho guanine nucleotide exchange factor 11-like [Podarcis muralis]